MSQLDLKQRTKVISNKGNNNEMCRVFDNTVDGISMDK